MNKLARILTLASIVGVLLIGAIRLSAEDAPKPKITDAQIIQFFKARAENAEAQALAAKTAATLQVAVEDMQKVCAVTLDAKGMPTCSTTEAKQPASK